MDEFYSNLIFWRVSHREESPRSNVFVWATEREEAKRQAQSWLGGDKEQYVVKPLTSPEDRIRIAINLFI